METGKADRERQQRTLDLAVGHDHVGRGQRPPQRTAPGRRARLLALVRPRGASWDSGRRQADHHHPAAGRLGRAGCSEQKLAWQPSWLTSRASVPGQAGSLPLACRQGTAHRQPPRRCTSGTSDKTRGPASGRGPHRPGRRRAPRRDNVNRDIIRSSFVRGALTVPFV